MTEETIQNTQEPTTQKLQKSKATTKVENSIPKLGIFKLDRLVSTPFKATEASSGMDVKVFLGDRESVTVYTPQNEKITRLVETDVKGRYVHFNKQERVLLPTGLILDIPTGYDVKVYPRSGLSLKNGLRLSNCTAVIDNDYVEELGVILTNDANLFQRIYDGERVAQMILEEVVQHDVVELNERPTTKTTRNGGFGSTGA